MECGPCWRGGIREDNAVSGNPDSVQRACEPRNRFAHSPQARGETLSPLLTSLVKGSTIWPTSSSDGKLIMEDQTKEAKWVERRRDLALLGLLLVLAAVLRIWVLCSTQVPARDSIGFIRYVLWFEQYGWSITVRNQHQHPGYPLTVLAVSWPVQQLAGLDCDTMQLSAQLASALAGLLLVVPMFYLGKFLFDPWAGFWGALLFQCLPVSGHLLSDAVSDPLFLLLLAGALALAVRAVRDRSPGWFALAGLVCGLAYLTRPEGVLILPAVGLTLFVSQLVPAWRQSWLRTAGCLAALIGAALVTGSPYYLTTGHFTNKPSRLVLAGKSPADSEEQAPASGQAPVPPTTEATAPPPALPTTAWVGPQIGTPKEIKEYQQRPLSQRLGHACWSLVAEFVRCYQYVGWLPVLLGLWWFRDRFRRTPGAWVVALVFLLDAFLLWLLVVQAGYVSGRHVLVLVLCTVFQAVAAVREVPYRLSIKRAAGFVPAGTSPAVWSLVLLLILTGTGLSRTLRPLHGNRAGHRAAGRWLAEHTNPSDLIDDDHCWAHYYANRVFQEIRPAAPPPGYRPRHYLVVNRSNDKTSLTRSTAMNETQIQKAGGQVVYHWPERASLEQARVLVYLLP
jgi:4-amino-4-deoxy-L-arabinose transferase-like glycosyltransferase